MTKIYFPLKWQDSQNNSTIYEILRVKENYQKGGIELERIAQNNDPEELADSFFYELKGKIDGIVPQVPVVGSTQLEEYKNTLEKEMDDFNPEPLSKKECLKFYQKLGRNNNNQ